MKNSLPKFLYAENKTELGSTQLIFCTEVPFFYAQVWKGIPGGNMAELAQQHQAIAVGKPLGYNIVIMVLGALHNSIYVKDMKRYTQELASVARDMADFYLQEKIHPNIRYYERYKD